MPAGSGAPSSVSTGQGVCGIAASRQPGGQATRRNADSGGKSGSAQEVTPAASASAVRSSASMAVAGKAGSSSASQ